MLRDPKPQEGRVHLFSLIAPVKSPRAQFNGVWIPTVEWREWSDKKRAELLGELLSHGTWFKGTPRRDVLESLFPPWVGLSMSGALQFSCAAPSIPEKDGSGAWELQAITIASSGIKPVWTLVDFTPDPEDDKVSLFGEALTAECSSSDSEGEDREIRIEDIPEATGSGNEPITRIRNRTWNAQRYAAKASVREAYLKMRIAEVLAQKEEARFIKHFGQLNDDESQFSDYDLTDGEETDGSAP
jgi:hypothetical protein